MDDPKFYLQWTFVNWITVVLMVAVAWVLLAGITSGIRQYRNTGVADDV